MALGLETVGEALSPSTGPIPLFNGRDLSGFYTWLVNTKRADPNHIFTVTNGCIRISGEGLGYLATEREYRDYVLVTEFSFGPSDNAWGDKMLHARDSGVFLHSFGPDGNSFDGNGAYRAAVECNIQQAAIGDFLLIRGHDANRKELSPRFAAEVGPTSDREGWWTWKRGGRTVNIDTVGRINWYGKATNWMDVYNFRGTADVENPPLHWNRLECICRGGRITARLNGVTVNEVFNVSPSEGKVLLQCEGSEVFFRKLDLLPLPLADSGEPQPGLRSTLEFGNLFIPAGGLASGKPYDLTLHFHGAPSVVEKNFVASGTPGILLTLTLPGLSKVYTDRFAAPDTLDRLLSEVRTVVNVLAGQSALEDGATGNTNTHGMSMGRLQISSFSAGFGAVREILKHPKDYDRVDALVMADSIYAGFSGNPTNRTVDPVAMEGFLRFAQDAAAGRKTMLISHSQLKPANYAATFETADFLLKSLSLERATTNADWGGGLHLLSEAGKGGFQLLGFKGETGDDHMAHLRQLSKLLSRVGNGALQTR